MAMRLKQDKMADDAAAAVAKAWKTNMAII
jgi:hypothetical protein